MENKETGSSPKYELVNTETGEILSSFAIRLSAPGPETKKEMEAKDKGFCKVFFDGVEAALGKKEDPKIQSKKIRLILWLVRHMSYKNELRYSYREMEKETGISYQTIGTPLIFWKSMTSCAGTEKC